MKLCIYLAVLLLAVIGFAQDAVRATTSIWPLPQSVSSGTTDIVIGCSNNVELKLARADLPPSAVAYITNAFKRFQARSLQDRPCHNANKSSSLLLSSLHQRQQHRLPHPQFKIEIASVDDPTQQSLDLGVNESYRLTVTSADDGGVTLAAATIFGINHAFSTLSQLISFDFSRKSFVLKGAPWRISDAPRFSYRGLLLDTARHFIPVRDLQRTIDAMAFTKLNVFHWHISDAQSFPLSLDKYPEIAEKGAWSPMERYSQEEVTELVQYGLQRSIKILPELDTPAHSSSLCKSHPEVCPAPLCSSDFPSLIENSFPLDFTKNRTYELVAGLISEYRKLFTTSRDLFHCGGDEVEYFCWEKRPYILKWLEQHGNLTMNEGLLYYWSRVLSENFPASSQSSPIFWQEVFQHFHQDTNQQRQLPRNSIIQLWKEDLDLMLNITGAGHRMIFSSDSAWYLDQAWVPAKKMYETEPCALLRSAKVCEDQVIGGSACAWSEFLDPSSLDMKLWPRANAVAERLWSSLDHTSKGFTAATEARLEKMRCLLLQSGVGAEQVKTPFTGIGPAWPSSCFS